MAVSEKVSFTIRRPTPLSRAPSSGADSDGGVSFKVPHLPRHLTNQNDSTPGSPLGRSATSSPKPSSKASYYRHEPLDSSDEDENERLQDELVTGFDKFGVQRCVSTLILPSQSCQLTKVFRNGFYSSVNKEKKRKASPLVIPALQNRDWRDLARKRRSAAQYVPASAKAETGKDGSVGGLGVKDSINSGPVLSGLQVKTRRPVKQEDDAMDGVQEEAKPDIKMEDEETEDQKALRAILAGANGIEHEGPMIDVIPTPIPEADAYKQDVGELPDVASLDDYARVPVSQFGAALLRGMGWKEARPALLGIGAKEREALDDGSQKKGNKRPEKRYVPVIKKEREGGSSTPDRRERSRSPRSRQGSSGLTSRRSSRSPGRSRSYDDRDRESSRRRRD
ncbi:hypothetical protein BDZ94DRAFT_1028145 [Collybia nuda]|uniref:Spp2/MOS2 G-patch domain-containing protein n=1 Tax=Collybia nuda TaxID=64659 RepID=A0A9P5YGN7_9AGAR|nr:hypothetical protein BDZ94DRAFT_1028145 [Collybia nuda]